MTVKQGIVHYTGTSGFLNIANSVFNNITGSYDGWVISTGAAASIANTNFTNLVSTQATSASYYGAVYTTKNMNVTGCLFKDITGPTGAAIYATGTLYSKTLQVLQVLQSMQQALLMQLEMYLTISIQPFQ